MDETTRKLITEANEACAAQETPEYQDLVDAAARKEEIDLRQRKAVGALELHFRGLHGDYYGDGRNDEASPQFDPLSVPRRGLYDTDSASAPSINHEIFGSEPERYELPEDETATAKPNGGLID